MLDWLAIIYHMHTHYTCYLQLRAPGSVVVIVGTHLDLMKDRNEISELETLAKAMYGTSSREQALKYPKVSTLESLD